MENVHGSVLGYVQYFSVSFGLKKSEKGWKPALRAPGRAAAARRARPAALLGLLCRGVVVCTLCELISPGGRVLQPMLALTQLSNY